MARLSPYVFVQEMDNNGDPLSSGKIYTYEAGTSTPKTTYTDSTGLSANTNPIILDSAGRADIWLDSGAYKFVIKTSADVTIKTVDNVAGDSENAFGSDVILQATSLAITSAHRNAAIYCTAALTFSLASAASLEEGFYFSATNASGGSVIIDPNGSETINGSATLTLTDGQSCLIITDGSNWYTFFNSPALGATLTAIKALSGLTDNRMLKTDGTAGLYQQTGITVDDSNNVSSMGTLGCGSITSTGSLTTSQTAGIIGTTTNNSANAGSVGEYIESEIASGSAVSLTTGVAANVTSISLTAGDWDVWGSVCALNNAATVMTAFYGAVTTTSATLPTQPNKGAMANWDGNKTGNSDAPIIPTGMRRISIASTTTVYLVAQSAFSVNSSSAFGFIGARRAR